MPIHKTALIHDTVQTGKNISIGVYSVVEEGTIIGDNVSIQGHVRIGKNCVINNGCVIKWGSILTQQVELMQGVFFGTQAVCLGSDSDRIESHGTIIGEGSYIGARAIIFPKVSIVDGVVIGAGSIIRHSIQAKGTYVGLSRRVE